MILEARCGRCGETFNPADETDLVHGQTEMEEECGGLGELVGSWGTAAELERAAAPDRTRDEYQQARWEEQGRPGSYFGGHCD